MRNSGDWLRQSIAGGLVLLLTVPFGEAATVQSQQAVPAAQTEGVSQTPSQSQNSDLPTVNPSSGVTAPETTPSNPEAASTQTTVQDQPATTSQPTPEPPQDTTSQPVGTAAAPYQKTTGVPASRPAGVVIAPAKQKRARSFLIRVSLLIGAAVAIGTVVALSKASPSRPH